MKDWKFLFRKYVLRRKPCFPEPEVLKVLLQVHGDLFVDIGANIGIYGRQLRYNFSTIYAFEPKKEAIESLKTNLNRGHYTIFPIALSDRKGVTTFYHDPHLGFNGSADTILPVFHYKPSGTGLPDNTYIGKDGVDVETDTYDNLVDQPADLVKIDTEGAEFLVLKGMEKALAHRRVNRIMVELHNRERKHELENLLTEYGFMTQWLDPDRIYGVQEPLQEYHTI